MNVECVSAGNVLVFVYVFQALLERTGYTLDVTTGQRKYGGPPPEDVFKGTQPGIGTEVYEMFVTGFGLEVWVLAVVSFDSFFVPNTLIYKYSNFSPSSGVCWKNPKGFV